eukprot:2083534-Pleurochrysis_carterae.AAC.1
MAARRLRFALAKGGEEGRSGSPASPSMRYATHAPARARERSFSATAEHVPRNKVISYWVTCCSAALRMRY